MAVCVISSVSLWLFFELLSLGWVLQIVRVHAGWSDMTSAANHSTEVVGSLLL